MTLVCVVCGVDFEKRSHTRDANLCCSRACGFQLQRQRGAAAKIETAKRRAALPRATYECVCKICSVSFVSARRGVKFCSESCRGDDARESSRKYQAAKFKLHRTNNPLPLTTHRCARCSVTFTVRGASRQKFCSLRCSNSEHGGVHAQRAKRFGAARDWTLKNQAVFERDKWRCQLCGQATPKRLRGSQQPNAPEVDHIIPLSAGGGHVWSNVQCACRDCNGKKGAKVLGQLRLAM